MDNLYYERRAFNGREAAWSHLEANWAENHPAIARKLDWEGVKATYRAATYWEGRWKLIREVVDYSEREPTPSGAREIIEVCPICDKSALVQKGDYLFKAFYVHLMGKEDNGKEVPILQHFVQRGTGGLLDTSNI